METEVIAIDFLSQLKDKSIVPNIKEYGTSAKAVWSDKYKCWSVHRKTKGEVENNKFTPYPGQSVKYVINLK